MEAQKQQVEPAEDPAAASKKGKKRKREAKKVRNHEPFCVTMSSC